MRLGELFRFQFLGNGCKGEDIIVLVVHLFSDKFFVSLADKIIFAVVGQHIAGEQRLCVKAEHAGRKAVICCFHIPVAVVDTDDFCVVHCFHHSIPFLRTAHFKKFRITYFRAVIQVRFAVRFLHTVPFRPVTLPSENNCSRYRAGK